MKSWKRKTALITGAALILVAASLVGLLHTPWAKRYALEQVRDYLRRTYGMELRAAGVRYNLLYPSITLERVSLRSTAAPHLPPLLELKRIECKFATKRLIRGLFSIDSARLEQANIRVVVDERGRNNLPKSAQPEPFESLPDFLIDSLEAVECSFSFADRRHGLEVAFPRLRLKVKGNPSDLSHDLLLALEHEGIARYQGRPLPIQKLDAAATARKTELEVTKLELRSGTARVDAIASLKNFGKPVLSCTLTPEFDLPQVLIFAGIKEAVGGKLRGSLAVRGPLEDVELSGRLEGRGVAPAGYDKFDFTTNCEWHSRTQRLDFKDFSATSPAGEVHGLATLALDPAGGNSEVDARVLSLDLQRVARYFGLPIEIASRASGSVTAHWEGLKPANLAGDSRLELASSRPQAAPNVLPLTAKVSLKFNNGQIFSSIDSARMLGMSLGGKISILSLDRMEGDFQGRVDRLDSAVSDWSVLLGGKGGDRLLQGLTGAASFTAKIAGTLQRPAALVALEAPSVQVGTLQAAGLKANAEIDRSRLLLKDAVVSLQDQTLHADGVVGLEGRDPSLNLHARLQDGSVASVLSAFKADVAAQGKFQAALDLGGTIANPVGDLTLSGSDLMLYGEPLGAFTAGARLENKRIETTHFILDKTPGDNTADSLKAKASYDLGSGQYSLQANGEKLKLDRLTLPGELPVQGTLSLSAQGKGTFDRPAIDLKLDLEDARINGKILGRIGAVVSLKDQQATIEARAPRLNISSRGSIRVQAPYRTEIEALAGNADLSLLGIRLSDDQALKGTLDATLKASGELGAWREGRASGQIRALKFAVRDQEIRNKGTLDIAYRDGSVFIDQATLVSGNSEVKVGGSFPVESQTSSGSLSLNGSLEMAQIFPFVPAPEGLYATGKLDLNLLLEGTLRRMRAGGRIKLADGFVHYPAVQMPLTDISLTSEIKDGAVVLDRLEARWASGKVGLTGELPLGLLPASLPFEFEKKSGPARFSFEVQGLRVESMGELPRGVGGSADFHVKGIAPSLELKDLEAEAAFDQLRIKVDEYALEQSEPSVIRIRDGSARIERFTLSGPETRVQLSGSAGLTGGEPLDVRVEGAMDAGILTFMTSGLRAAGDTRFRLNLGGNLSAPQFSGFATMQKGQVALATPAMEAGDLDVSLSMNGNVLKIEKFSGALNGGTLSAGGSVGFERSELTDFNIDAAAQNVFLDFPKGLKTLTNGDLKIRSSEGFIDVSGTARVLEGSYREPLDIEGELLSYLRAGQVAETGRERNPFPSRIRYNISLESEGPVTVDNNLAKLAAAGNLKLVGTYYQPSLLGRISLEEGGEIYLNERKYLVERGVIDFSNQTHIEPSLDVLATTKADIYDITLHARGTPKDLSTTLTSEPPLPQPDIISVLLTGRTLDKFRGQEMTVAKEQALSLLGGKAGESISRGAQKALGLSSVRIEPNLISAESDPGARLTVGQNLMRDLQLIYSMDLRNSGNQIWIAEYDLQKRFNLRGIKQDDNTYRFDFWHDLRFGGPSDAGKARSAARPRKEIGSMEFTGDTAIPEKTLSKQLKLEPGNKYDFFKVQKGKDRLQKYYAQQGRLESRVFLKRDERNGKTDLTFNIRSGPIVEFKFEGTEVSGTVKERVQQIWKEGVFDAQRAAEAIQAIQKPLVAEGYLQAAVRYEIEKLDDRKIVHFRITPGPRFENVKLVFEGASAIESSELEKQLEPYDLRAAVFTQPEKVVDFLVRLYHRRGYLSAHVDPPRLELDSQTRTGQAVLVIKEGPAFRTGDLKFNGNEAFGEDKLKGLIPLKSGDLYTPALGEESLDRMESFYRSNGYNEARISYRITPDTGAGLAQVSFDIVEGRQGRVRDVVIEGAKRTTDAFVRRQLTIGAGDILDFEQVNRSRKNLYDTGIYTQADFDTEELAETGAEVNPKVKPVRLRVKLREVTPYRLRYGASYDTERGIGVIADATNANFLGKAAIVGLRTRYDADLKEIRAYFSQPVIRGIPLKSDVTAFLRREIKQDFITDRLGFSLQQEKRLRNRFLFNYGYRYERTHTFDREPDPDLPFDITIPVARLTATLNRDTRDDLLDATRGSFTSHAVEYAPKRLGSDIRLIKYFGQYFHYLPLRRQEEVSHGAPARTRLVYAGALRIGLAKGLDGQDILPSERFFAGGGTTVRGFGQDGLGPVDFAGNHKGGNALFIVNNEIRFPIVSIFDGVGFLDIGNVYSRISDFNPIDVRKSAGFGLRVRTGFVLIRFDYGLKLDRKPGESRGGFFFSIGQAY